MVILIGSGWPYANGSLHIGHIAGLLPGDVLARYFRLKGDQVCYVSGTDCYGTPISMKAKKENKQPSEIAEWYHEEFVRCFDALGFSYDHYGRTTSGSHREFVKQFHRRLYQSGSVFEKTTDQAFCGQCGKFLPDRYVSGICPNCGKQSRGDQCESCGSVFDSVDLLCPVCVECGLAIVRKPSKHLHIRCADFSEEILSGAEKTLWRKNAVDFTERYVGEGLRDRALTRDLDWGIPVPAEGYEDKKIYIWAENILGYLSGCQEACEKNGENFSMYWNNDEAVHYYVHGKDNIPFHTVILPALLLAEGSGYHRPDAVIASEYMTLEGRKISTSENHAVWVQDLLELYNPDAIRYYLIANGPEKRDADFTFKDFAGRNNSDLVGVYGNFVNRTLVFITKYLDGVVPEGKPEAGMVSGIDTLFTETGDKMAKGCFKDALNGIFVLIREGNKYYDEQRPWETRTTDPAKCRNAIFNCVQRIAAAAVLLEPFLPFSSRKMMSWLGIPGEWRFTQVSAGVKITGSEILFQRIV